MSLGGGGFNQVEADTYERMLNVDNVLLIAAAGNAGNNGFSYPASYESVMSVAAVDSNENIASFSQHNNQVDIAAPGVGVKSTYKNGSYASLSGTSMATPHVAGVAALVWSRDTTKSAKEVWSALTQSAKDKGDPGRDDYFGHGIVQAADAALLLADEGFTLSPTASPTVPLPCIDDPVGWYDIDGPTYDCVWYKEGNNCEVHGDNYKRLEHTANTACCACGGGARTKVSPAPTVTVAQSPTATPSKLPSSKPTTEPTSSPSGVCTDDPVGWYDIDGPIFDCAWYKEGNNCSLFGNNYENFGKTANQVCCVCGGGNDSSPPNSPISPPTSTPSNTPSKLKSDVPSMLPTKVLTVSPSSGPTPTPSNTPSKLKSDVPSMLPTKVPTASPSSGPTPAPSKSPVVSMLPTKVPTVSPTSKPSKSPVVIPQLCYETDRDWYDIDGPTYDCAWYGLGDNCFLYGDLYERLGTTANQVCCECGGGSSFPPPFCTDSPLGWYDIDGPTYDCEWYAKGRNCLNHGDFYASMWENKLTTANEACCACAGGEYLDFEEA